MKASVLGAIALFSPKGFLDHQNAQHQITLQDIHDVTGNPAIHYVLISVSQIFHFNPRGLQVLVNILREIRNRSGVEIGFCDYFEHKRYEMLQQQIGGSSDLHFFETLKIAQLLMGQLSESTSGTILLYEKEKGYTDRIAMSLRRMGYRTETEPFLEKFQQKRFETKHYALAIECSSFGGQNDQIIRHKHGRFVIYDFGNAIDSESMDTFNWGYHRQLLAIGFRFYILNASQVRSINTYGIQLITNLASEAMDHGAVVFVTGLFSGALSYVMRQQLEQAGIVFYEEVQDVIEDEALLSSICAFEGSGWKRSLLPDKINKQTLRMAPLLTSAVSKTLATIVNQPVRYGKVKLGPLGFNNNLIEEYAACAIGFQHAWQFEIFIVLHAKTAEEAKKILLGNNANDRSALSDTLVELLTIIGQKVRISLSQKGHQVVTTPPKSYESIREADSITRYKKGMVINMNIDDTPAYLLVA